MEVRTLNDKTEWIRAAAQRQRLIGSSGAWGLHGSVWLEAGSLGARSRCGCRKPEGVLKPAQGRILQGKDSTFLAHPPKDLYPG